MTNATPVRLPAGLDPPRITELLSALWSIAPTVVGREATRHAAARIACLDGAPAEPDEVGLPPARWLLRVRPYSPGARSARVARSVVFTDDAAVPWPFRGRRLTLPLPSDVQPLNPLDAERVLASADGQALWTIDESRADSTVHTTAMALPDREPATAGTSARWSAETDHVLDWVPLLQFLRSAAAAPRFDDVPMRAAFIIDDPNLHWPSYGYVNYREIAVDAQRHGYHVAFATIPLDAWFTHQASAGIFRAHPRQLSLLVHGNNHAKHELARVDEREAIDALLSQALHRIERLESSAGLDVCRVMVPPHGACSAAMLARLPLHGFESACISSGSLREHNRGAPWAGQLGLTPVEMLEGCPVLPRWAFASSNDASLALAAYLGKPLILRGHHQDLREGLDLFRAFAGRINALGMVEWANLSQISRRSYQCRREGSLLRIKPWTKRITVELPSPEAEIVIDGDGAPWSRVSAKPVNGATGPARSLVLARVPDSGAAWPLQGPRAGLHSGLVLRRLLTETRDRFLH